MSAQPLFSRTAAGSVSSLGEGGLIRRIRTWLGRANPPSPFGMGDDCAVIRPARGRGLITIDPVIYGVHFDGRVSAAQAGAKLVRRNVSDIAAMGGRPLAAVVALALDGRVSTAWLGVFYRGLAREALRQGLPVVGGDVARLDGHFVATLALTGEAPGRVLARSGSRVGDWIYVTGSLGRSLPSGHHHRFRPRLAEGQWLARQPSVRAMMDVSDGLARDLPSLCPPGAVPAVYASLLPRRQGAGLREVLCDGEDYELVFSVAAASRRAALEAAWRRAFPGTRLTCIGRFVRAGHLPPDAVDLAGYHAYEHLR